MTEQEIILRRLNYRTPPFVSGTPCVPWVLDYIWPMAEHLGALVGVSEMNVDDAYLQCRQWAETLHALTHSPGYGDEPRPWQQTMPSLTQQVDEMAARTRAVVELADAQAERELRRIAAAGLAKQLSSQAIRRQMVAAAETMPFPPPEDVLHAALAAAASGERWNARWLASREAAG